ncbi:5-deoxy-glucuronate isomerase [Microvirga massiliensis]|uniref:5-deoxy-glucuronate isomerase n=1 Tax=Microvirga massiliensis TaxID=1033741 RepID=UPI00062BCDEC|nr:5-deoxy-glucuronate isomerase [Microvirga massiliensis]
MSKLLVRPSGQKGQVHHITPEGAGWTYVGFDVHVLSPGETVAESTGAREVCLVVISGKARIETGDKDFGAVGERMTPFEGKPWSVYVPAGRDWRVTALTDLEVAICSAPGEGSFAPRLIGPDDVTSETRGTGTNTRHVANILPETAPAHSLLVVEVITPAGHWSSYPPHKHDRDALPDESALEETYYHRIDPPQGYALHRIYTDDRSLDETLVIEDRSVSLVPRGYHPVGAAHGYRLYYLNVMAGPKRTWRFHNDPAHEWLMAAG